ncbi:hypothetical protein GLOTRDRAFT_99242 [Gloeophyllum trabeum ATCC 11539]|uniref:Uncharacterized protein n=1 Tax=Gloeophyllum trabeum (strain ATCC 11539 / FP-39264 / Madison 617) TaxID=670483 RepID=S7QCI5_GLOTA|nr:uncharacterized protein GLOTRDRAFT_99242 [Gloeophyllum trabeum ATCC 11539]EPQ57098.1 hypothetical protein GLOTRDRAFT_99242 [Gloeophyllum trabeum ATCC 11539]
MSYVASDRLPKSWMPFPNHRMDRVAPSLDVVCRLSPLPTSPRLVSVALENEGVQPPSTSGGTVRESG